MIDETPNIFQMFVANGCQAGFWIKRKTWGNSCARVTEVGQLTGPAPYFGNPKVFAEIYDAATGELKDARARVPVPGTYKTWRRISPPPWAFTLADIPSVQLRPQAPADSVLAMRIYFKVPYERREDIKALGGRWDAGKKLWWLPVDQARAIAATRAAEFAEVVG